MTSTANASELESGIKEAVIMLWELEWSGRVASDHAGIITFSDCCPICRASRRDGHSRKGCRLAEFLRKHAP